MRLAPVPDVVRNWCKRPSAVRRNEPRARFFDTPKNGIPSQRRYQPRSAQELLRAVTASGDRDGAAAVVGPWLVRVVSGLLCRRYTPRSR